ncbi:MAG TPA: 4-alpha-glucanotransferase [Myxococcota bacterium]|nr:4-alpha-glucanotransferase [Myxococcota bacterium]
MAEARPQLHRLARALGIEDGYESALDGRFVETSDATREALAAAMGFAADGEAEAERSLERFEARTDPPPLAPGRCLDAGAKLGGRRVFGVCANLYSARSRRDDGFGDFGVLRELVRHTAEAGGAFVGLNPLHATLPRPERFCPYQPVSRLFLDPLYLDLTRVPEMERSAETRRRLASPALRRRLEALRTDDTLDPAGVEAARAPLLAALHAAFRDASGSDADARRRAFARFAAERGEALRDFATFLALADHFEATTGGRDWGRWPGDLRSPASPAVARFREAHADAVDRHAWIQFELDRQLGEVSRLARGSGLALGLYADLALGSSAGGADAWSRPDLYASGVSVGAPPDAFSRSGQDWGFPPLDPHALRADGYRHWGAILDASLRHAGALRLDHAMGLRRLFWIPTGASPAEGAYVRYPTDDLVALLADASRRHDAVVVAEDLGTVPPGFSEGIRELGMLSSRVLLFERDADGFFAADRYPERCLASANTHDLPPLAALEGDEDLALRRRVGQIADDATLAAARRERSADRRALVERLSRDGYLDADAAAGDGPDGDALAAAVTAFLCATPSLLVGVSLDDLAGEREPVNLPGVSAERHPSWTRRMHAPLDAIFAGRRARAMLASVPAERRRP